MTKLDVVEANQILHVTVGSQLTGTNLPGTSDNDEISIFVENKESVYGMAASLDHLSVRTQPEGVRSGPSDTDKMAYSLRKYCYLAAKGNPSILLPLFAPDNMILNDSEIGRSLRANAHHFLSQEAGKRFLGYAYAQYDRMNGKGRQSRVPKRPELEEKYGYDVKYASHALRLSIQGWELLTTGKLSLPMNAWQVDTILAIRNGEYEKEDVADGVMSNISSIREILDNGTSVLPLQPNYAAISAFSIAAHESFWKNQAESQWQDDVKYLKGAK